MYVLCSCCILEHVGKNYLQADLCLREGLFHLGAGLSLSCNVIEGVEALCWICDSTTSIILLTLGPAGALYHTHKSSPNLLASCLLCFCTLTTKRNRTLMIYGAEDLETLSFCLHLIYRSSSQPPVACHMIIVYLPIFRKTNS